AARLLYREWFVRLRFPGHEHAKIKDGIPEGWKRGPLGQLCVEVREICQPASLEPDAPYIGLEHMPRRSIALSEWGTTEQVTSSKHRFRENDILFGKIRPYFHKVGIALTEGIASSDAIVIRPASQELLPLVLMVTSSDAFVADTAQKMKEGSKMPRADWKQMTQYPVLYPSDNTLWALNDFIEPILQQIKTLVFSNRNLAVARDLLLPKLMSGEVAV
ncbi:MAG TPA: restriction endonuclease subunit S, partial [Kiritimatiellia bacterium]|nr:restriction endonuclease subunit S [Kiritimatiellia bacterium]